MVQQGSARLPRTFHAPHRRRLPATAAWPPPAATIDRAYLGRRDRAPKLKLDGHSLLFMKFVSRTTASSPQRRADKNLAMGPGRPQRRAPHLRRIRHGNTQRDSTTSASYQSRFCPCHGCDHRQDDSISSKDRNVVLSPDGKRLAAQRPQGMRLGRGDGQRTRPSTRHSRSSRPRASRPTANASSPGARQLGFSLTLTRARRIVRLKGCTGSP